MATKKTRFIERTGRDFPTDDHPDSIQYRMDAVEHGITPVMPGLARMTKKQMAAELQSIWTLMDERGINRTYETKTLAKQPRETLTIYGRVYSAIQRLRTDH